MTSFPASGPYRVELLGTVNMPTSPCTTPIALEVYDASCVAVPDASICQTEALGLWPTGPTTASSLLPKAPVRSTYSADTIPVVGSVTQGLVTVAPPLLMRMMLGLVVTPATKTSP